MGFLDKIKDLFSDEEEVVEVVKQETPRNRSKKRNYR